MKLKSNIKVASKFITITLVISMILQTLSVVALQKPSSSLPQPLGVGSPVIKIAGKGSAGTVSGKEFCFSATLNNATQNFYLSFPTFGGIRLTTTSINDSKSIFEPESYNTIKSTTNGTTTTLTAGSMAVDYTVGNNYWNISFKKNNGETFTLSSDNLIFGYESSGFRNNITYTGDLGTDEIIYGSGQRFNGFVLNGKDFLLWNTDGYGTSDETLDRSLSYANVPIFHSSTGYSIYFNSYYQGKADIGKTDSSKYTVSIDNGRVLDIFLWNSSPIENIKSYTSLTGNPVAAPEWAYHYQIGSTHVVWGDDEDSFYMEYKSRSRLKSVLDKYKNLGTMPYALYGEGYPSNYKSTYDLVNGYGVRMLRWNYPGMSQATVSSLLPDILEDNLPLVKYRADRQEELGVYTPYVDYTSNDAVALISKYYSNYLSWGLKGAMVDYGEYIQWFTNAQNGMDGTQLHNAYAYYYNKIMREVFSQNGTNEDFLLFARAGAAGSQAYAANFFGDQEATFMGLKEQISAMLSMSASGFATLGGDIGGLKGQLDSELYSRWLQLGTFSPLMRTHGSWSGGGDVLTSTRDPWNYGKEEVFKGYYYLRENIAKYVYSAALKSEQIGEPIVKALPVAFPNEDSLFTVDDQYMFGDSIMVTPVTTSGAVSRNVVFPNGKWYDLYTGSVKSYESSTMSVDAPEDYIPAYLKSGAVLPVEIAETLNLKDAFTEEDAVNALIVSQPETDTIYNHYTDDGVLNYHLFNGNNGYYIASDSANQTRTVILYSEEPTAVSVDSVELVNQNIDTDCWYKDGDRIIIKLSDDWSEIKVSLPESSETVDSTRNWFKFAGNTDTTGLISTFWNKDSGYVKNDSVDLNVWQPQPDGWGYYENKNAIYANDWSNGGHADNLTFLSVNDNSFRNFELDVRINGMTTQSTVMVAMREKTPGQPVSSIGSYDFGKQPDGSESLVLRYFTNENKVGIFSGGVKLFEASGITGINAWNWFKIRVVGNIVTVYLCDSNTGNYTRLGSAYLSKNCEKQGYISVGFGNCKGAVYGITLTRLDEAGRPTEYSEDKDISINNLNDLQKIGVSDYYPLNGNYILNSDITITANDSWTAISGFTGLFDGNGHKITGLTDALFYSTDNNATIKNTVLINASVKGGKYCGGTIVRYAGDTVIENVAVINSSVNTSSCGAFVGTANGTVNISNCSFTGTLYGSEYCAGFIGQGSGAKIIKNSYSNGVFTNANAVKRDFTFNKFEHTEASVTNSYYLVSQAKSLETLGFSEEYWVHDGELPQLKITGAENYISGDANLDKAVDIRDLVAMKKHIVGINMTYFSVLAGNFDGVFEADGLAVVNASDLAAIRKSFLK